MAMIFRKLVHFRIVLILLCSGVTILWSQNSLSDFLNHNSLDGAQVGISVINAKTGETLIGYNDDKYFTPASTLKLITGYAGLKLLGPQFTFNTDLAYSGKIEEGVLKGDLIVIGGGDPTLGSERFPGNKDREELLKTIGWIVQKEGIKEINGNITIYSGRYEDFEEIEKWPFQDLANYYGTSASSINIQENSYEIHFERSVHSGVLTHIKQTNPPIDTILWNNRVKTGSAGSGDQAYIHGSPFSREREIRGTIPAGKGDFVIRGSLPYPAFHFGKWIQNELKRRDISVHGKVIVTKETSEQGYTQLANFKSPTLLAIVKEMNERSVNLYAEAIIKEIAYQKTGFGKTSEGIKEVLNLLIAEKDKFKMVDGSGLSPFNAISPAVYNRFLMQASQDAKLKNDFLGTMAVYGRTGTLKSVLRNSSLTGKVRGKSGSITGVRAYSGHLISEKGTELCFVVFMDKFYERWSETKPAFEKFIMTISRDY